MGEEDLRYLSDEDLRALDVLFDEQQRLLDELNGPVAPLSKGELERRRELNRALKDVQDRIAAFST